MVYLILSIISSTFIFIIFRFITQFRHPVLPVIVINYFFASLGGWILSPVSRELSGLARSEWAGLAVLIGILFILMFFVIGKSSDKAGLNITTVASKMSVVVPISFSLIYDPSDQLTLLKLAGILAALISIFMIIFPGKSHIRDKGYYFYPILLFAGMGITDSLLKFAQYNYVNDHELPAFSAILFLISFLTGILILGFRDRSLKALVKPAFLGWGFLLGISNFGSIYFFVRALNYRGGSDGGTDSSVVFGVNNTGIVLLSFLAAVFFFRERMNPVNIAGVFVSILAIYLFSIH